MKKFSEDISLFLAAHPYQNVQIGKANFRYVLAGENDKPVVVLLTGGMNSSEMWFEYVDALSDQFRVLIFDYPLEYKTNDETADGIALFLDELHIHKAVIVGASYGGFMAQIFTQRHPQYVEGLGLFSTAALDEVTIRNSKQRYKSLPVLLFILKHFNHERIKPKLMAASLKHAENESKEDQIWLKDLFTYVLKDFSKEKDVHITSLMAGLMKQPPCTQETFAFLGDHIVLILPEKDYFSEEEQAALKALFPKAKVIYVQNGHLGTILDPEIYIAAIRELEQRIALNTR